MEMGKLVRATEMNYEGKIFIPKVSSVNGEVDNHTIFHYHQNGCVLWADYMGGQIIKGHLIGTVSDVGILDFHYHHININNQVRIGKCHSIPYIFDDGNIEIHEEWQWLNGDESKGVSIISEL